jgi:CheY-like chemotaxis protein
MACNELERLSVLVVEDNRNMSNLIKQVLRTIGVRQVRIAFDGVDAFKEMRNNAIDIVLCDLAMEPINGIEFTQLVRTAPDSPNPYVPVIMLTGHTERGNVKAARDAGVTEFLSKPISPLYLYRRIIQVIDQPRPFIRCASYVGPCRRRKQLPFAGPERRTNWEPPDTGQSSDRPISNLNLPLGSQP